MKLLDLKTLIREQIKVVISESRYDNLVTYFSRDIIAQIKKKKFKYFKKGILASRSNKDNYKSMYGFSDEDAEFSLKVKIIYDSSFELPFDITAVTANENIEDLIELEITINPTNFPLAYNDLIAELKGTLRHEIEHLAQLNFTSKQMDVTSTTGLTGFKYFIAPSEVPAFVHGFHKQAKTSGKTWTSVATDYLKTQKEKKLTAKEINKILDVWMTYAKKNIPNAKY